MNSNSLNILFNRDFSSDMSRKKFSDLSPITQSLILTAISGISVSALTPLSEVAYSYSSKLMDKITPKSIREIKPDSRTYKMTTNAINYPNQMQKPQGSEYDKAINWILEVYGDKPITKLKEGLDKGYIPVNYRAYVANILDDINISPINSIFNDGNSIDPNTILRDYLNNIR